MEGKRKTNGKITQHHKDIAAALQSRIEEVVLNILKYLKKKYKIENLCILEVGLNCSLNGKIMDSKLFEKIYVQPASSDSGIALELQYLDILEKTKKKVIYENTYLGSSFTDQEIKKL